MASLSLKNLIIEIQGLLNGLKVNIRVNLFGIITIDLEKLIGLEKKAKGAGALNESVIRDDVGRRANGRADLSARDNVLLNWERLNQIIKDVARAQEMQVSAAAQTTEIVGALASMGTLEKVVATLVTALYDEGKKIKEQPGKKIFATQAAAYQRLVASVLTLLGKLLIPPPPRAPISNPPRPTIIGDYVPSSASGALHTILSCIKGPLVGKQFRVDQEFFRIGAGGANDLIISADSYVSEKHAYIRHGQDRLWLADQESLNGTFLNDERLNDTPLTLNAGDRIRVGLSVFKVIRSP